MKEVSLVTSRSSHELLIRFRILVPLSLFSLTGLDPVKANPGSCEDFFNSTLEVGSPAIQRGSEVDRDSAHFALYDTKSPVAPRKKITSGTDA